MHIGVPPRPVYLDFGIPARDCRGYQQIPEFTLEGLHSLGRLSKVGDAYDFDIQLFVEDLWQRDPLS